MTHASPFLVAPTAGFSPEIGRLVAMMTYARRTTLEAARGLTVAQLDHLYDANSNSIGALLAHIAAIEVAYQRSTFHHSDLSDDDRSRWGAAIELGEAARRELRGQPLEHYLSELAEVRERTLAELARRDDDWLEQTTPFWGGHLANNHFKWFHVFEDEINHRGQIRWLRKRLPKR
jgi:uncharacterized damage-inducible protein DinB